MVVKKAGCVKDVVNGPFPLVRDSATVLALQTPSTNGANVVFKLYIGLNGERYPNSVEMQKPEDSSAAGVLTSLTGASKMGVVPYLAQAATECWVIRTDADAAADATFVLSGVEI